VATAANIRVRIRDRASRVHASGHKQPFWIADFGFWIENNDGADGFQSKIRNPKSKIDHAVATCFSLIQRIRLAPLNGRRFPVLVQDGCDNAQKGDQPDAVEIGIADAFIREDEQQNVVACQHGEGQGEDDEKSIVRSAVESRK
jgi:hypothetical protein